MSRRRAWKGAVIGGAFRAVLLVLMLAMQASPGEGARSFLLDLPTIGIYFVLGALGIHLHIVDAADPLFHVVGMAVWAVAGFAIGFVMDRIRVRPTSAPSR